MPGTDLLTFDFRQEVDVQKSARVRQMSSLFDVPLEEKSAVHLKGELDLPDDWQVGLIVGPSGSGKTSIARHLFGDKIISGFDWDGDRSILDAFPKEMGIKDITSLLCNVGFGTSPNWVRPFRVLSNGEQFRVTVARALAEIDGLVVIDEFTSVIDRQVAQVASHTVQKAVRKTEKQLVAVSCHADVIDWLQPDWIYQPELEHFERRCLRRRPEFDLKVYQVDKTVWNLFSKYHYMSPNLHKGAQCFAAFIGDRCVAFTSYIHFAHPSHKNIKKGHRLVVHPDWQGLGIGGILDNWLGQYLYELGFYYYCTVAHPAMIAFYSRSPRWKMTTDSVRENTVKKGGRRKTTGRTSTVTGASKAGRQRQWQSALRATKTFCYVPPKSS